MIPKIIHYTWFSGEEMPQRIQDCIESWKKLLPDYKLRLWDMAAIAGIDSVFLKEVLSVKKWAYAADYVRLYALYHEGGIYLDTDVMVLKSFDDLLDNHVFIGKENSLNVSPVECRWAQYLSSHCMGAEAGSVFIKDCLRYYENRHFIQSEDEELPTVLRYNYIILPYIQAVIAQKYGYDWRPQTQTTQHCKSGLVVYPSDCFDGLDNLPCTYCQHLALGSWREDYILDKEHLSIFERWKRRIARKIKKILLVNFSYTIQKVQ